MRARGQGAVCMRARGQGAVCMRARGQGGKWWFKVPARVDAVQLSPGAAGEKGGGAKMMRSTDNSGRSHWLCTTLPGTPLASTASYGRYCGGEGRGGEGRGGEGGDMWVRQ
jgi:hypothetical protein